MAARFKIELPLNHVKNEQVTNIRKILKLHPYTPYAPKNTKIPFSNHLTLLPDTNSHSGNSY